MTTLNPGRDTLLTDVRALITEAQHQATAVVNMGLTMFYWRNGKRFSSFMPALADIRITAPRGLIDERHPKQRF